MNELTLTRFLTTLAALALALPSSAATFEVINPNETMVEVPGLFMGPSRISTVEFCAEANEIDDWENIITDEDFENMEACLVEMT